MRFTDEHGLPLSTSSAGASAAYRDGVRLLLSAWPGAGERLDAAIEADPGFALAHAARARLHAIEGESGPAKAAIGRAAQLVSGASERERSHVAALALVIAGKGPDALAATLAHVDRWPRDVLILGLPLGAFGLFAFSGMADHDEARVNLVERHAAHFSADDWWFLTYRGWALVEHGEVSRGRTMLERAIHLRPENANGAHAFAHGLHEAGAGEEASAFVHDWLPGYDRNGVLHGHIAWHAALAALERGDAADALAIHAEHVRPSISRGLPINVVSDGASLLWRLAAYGHAVPDGLWQDLADYARDRFPEAGHAFIDTHMTMIEAVNGDADALERRLAASDKLVATGMIGAGSVAPTLGRALAAFAGGDHVEAIRLLEPLGREVARIGGSGAQREVIEDTLIVAYMREGRVGEARTLLERRLHRRVSARDRRWLGGLSA